MDQLQALRREIGRRRHLRPAEDDQQGLRDPVLRDCVREISRVIRGLRSISQEIKTPQLWKLPKYPCNHPIRPRLNFNHISGTENMTQSAKEK